MGEAAAPAEVKAARAADAGRDFAVIASQVRALAQCSAEAAKEIKTLVQACDAQVGAESVEESTAASHALAQESEQLAALIARPSAWADLPRARGIKS